MSPKNVTKDINQKNVMQLATSANNESWVCTLHFYADNRLNLYWMSKPDRWHSQQLSQNPQAAATILIHENNPREDYVLALTIAGQAELVENIDPDIGQAYVQKLAKEPTLLDDIASGQNPHKFYRLKPERIVLFDTKNFPEDPKQELEVCE